MILPSAMSCVTGSDQTKAGDSTATRESVTPSSSKAGNCVVDEVAARRTGMEMRCASASSEGSSGLAPHCTRT